MKKIVLFFITALLISSCDIEDDGPRIAYEYAEVTAADLPESFIMGNVYEIDVTYVLPSACHMAAGVDVRRGGIVGAERRKVYIAGVAAYDANLANCDEEGDEEALTKEGTFTITIDEAEPFTFFLWTGTDSNGQNQYTTVEVPVSDGPPGGQN